MIALMMFLFIAGPNAQQKPVSCIYAGVSIPCDLAYIPKMVRKDGLCPISKGYDMPSPGVVCINGYGYAIDVRKPQSKQSKPVHKISAHKKTKPTYIYKGLRSGGSVKGSDETELSVEHYDGWRLTEAPSIVMGTSTWGAGDESIPSSGSISVTTEGYEAADSITLQYYSGPSAMISTATDGGKAVKLTDAEYANLQALRKAVMDEEKRLAVKYGLDLGEPSCLPMQGYPSACSVTGNSHPADHYEYHGQFLLIDKAAPAR
ncbi:MAG TPA: hypothetical protein VGU67_03020 [Edaphobacter sp.]|nr:hypothetical protein [Edaphobacter sp.]